MPRPITNPTVEDLELMVGEPVEILVEPIGDAIQVVIYRGILEKSEGAWLIRSFGDYSVQTYRDGRVWTSIRRLEALELTPDEQQRWMAHEPISAMVYVQLEADKGNRPILI